MKPSFGDCFGLLCPTASRSRGLLWSIGAMVLVLQWAVCSAWALRSVTEEFYQEHPRLESRLVNVHPSALPRGMPKSPSLGVLLNERSESAALLGNSLHAAIFDPVDFEIVGVLPQVSNCCISLPSIRRSRVFNSRAPPARAVSTTPGCLATA